MRSQLIGAAACLSSAPSSLSAETIKEPDWERRPDGEVMSRYYPAAPQVLQLSGLVTLSCAVDEFGRLEGCKTTHEQPAGLGFGSAALSMKSHFQMRPTLKNGHPVKGGAVHIPIRFAMPPGDPPAAAVVKNPSPSESHLRLAQAVAAKGLGSTDRYLGGKLAPILSSQSLIDPSVKLDIIRALDEAANEFAPEARDEIAKALAQRHTAQELVLLRDAAAAKPLSHDEQMQVRRASAPIIRLWSDDIRRRTREVFCNSRDCSTSITRADRARTLSDDTAIAPDSWAAQPSAWEIVAGAPRLANFFGIAGLAVMKCTASMTGRLTNCSVVAEQPKELGYADAALKLSDRFQLAPQLVGLGVTGESVIASIEFKAAPEAKPLTVAPGGSASASALSIQVATSLRAAHLDALDGFLAELPVAQEQHKQPLMRALEEAKKAALRQPVDAEAAHLGGALDPGLLQRILESEQPQAIRDLQPKVEETLARPFWEFDQRLTARAQEIFCAKRDCLRPPPKP